MLMFIPVCITCICNHIPPRIYFLHYQVIQFLLSTFIWIRFIASEKRGENLHIELWLLTEFHEHGSLYDYLKGHVLTWSQLCKIGESMALGLAFLHDEIPATAVHVCEFAVVMFHYWYLVINQGLFTYFCLLY